MDLTSNEKQLILNFLNEFQKNGKDLYQEIDLDNVQNDLDSGSILEIELYDAPRDLFYDSKTFLNWIQSSVEENSETAQFFNLSGIQKVFSNSGNDGDGDSYHFIFASEEDGLFVSLSGSMGEYCDENYDATAYISFDFKSSKENTHQRLLKTVSNTVREFAATLQSKVDEATADLPASLKQQAQHIMLEEFSKIECLHPVLVEKSRQELMSHVESVQTNTKPQKMRKV